MMTHCSRAAARRGYVAQTIIVILLIAAAMIGYHFFSQNSRDTAQDIKLDIEQTQRENVQGLEDDPATAPPAAKRAREMENISEMY